MNDLEKGQYYSFTYKYIEYIGQYDVDYCEKSGTKYCMWIDGPDMVPLTLPISECSDFKLLVKTNV